MADFSNIKFNGVEYGLKDRTSRQDINSLDERVTQVENKIPEILEFESFDALQAAYQADPTKFVEGTIINLTKGDYCDVATYGGEFSDYVTGYCPPQIFRLNLNPYGEPYCFFLYQLDDSEGEFYFGEMFLLPSDYPIEFNRIESPYTLANPSLDGISIDDLPELSAVRASNGFYKIPKPTGVTTNYTFVDKNDKEILISVDNGLIQYIGEIPTISSIKSYTSYGDPDYREEYPVRITPALSVPSSSYELGVDFGLYGNDSTLVVTFSNNQIQTYPISIEYDTVSAPIAHGPSSVYFSGVKICDLTYTVLV